MPSPNVLWLILLGAIWGASFLLIKIGTTEIAPLTFAMLRIAIGGITTGLVIAATRQRLPRGKRVWGHLLFMALLGLAFPFAAISWGTQYIPSSLSAILNGLMPIFTFIVAVLGGDERSTARRFFGVILGFIGTAALVVPQFQRGGMQVGVLGTLAIVLAALSYAIAVVYARKHVSHLSPQVASFGQLVLATLILVPFALVEPSWKTTVTLHSILPLVFLGVVGTSLAYMIYYRLIRDAGSTFTSLVTYISPPFGVFWGKVILNEPITWNVGVALALITLGLLFVRAVPKADAAPASALPETADSGA